MPGTLSTGDTISLTSQPGGTTVVLPVVAKTTPTMTVKRTPKKVVRKRTRATLTIRVSDAALTPTGSVAVRVDGKAFRTKALVGGRAVVRLKRFATAGVHTVKVAYTGDVAHNRTAKTIRIRVRR